MLKCVQGPCSQCSSNEQITRNRRRLLCVSCIRYQRYSLKNMLQSDLQLVGINHSVSIISLEETSIKIVFLAQFNHIIPDHFIPLFQLLAQFSIHLCIFMEIPKLSCQTHATNGLHAPSRMPPLRAFT
uniref:Uncharacterized protein n=1 Tax=Opuntia streptacantha TaxID=393608 RepID=A0A7C9AR93_OPUST